MSPVLIEMVGIAAGTLTTICWLPQVVSIIRKKSTRDISLLSQSAFTAGIFLWFSYGVLLERPALILANGITLFLSALIVILKLRFG
jgi:MtN3 and saliva related transmembrane protein